MIESEGSDDLFKFLGVSGPVTVFRLRNNGIGLSDEVLKFGICRIGKKISSWRISNLQKSL